MTYLAREQVKRIISALEIAIKSGQGTIEEISEWIGERTFWINQLGLAEKWDKYFEIEQITGAEAREKYKW